jgi:hypothetical protein
VRRGCVEELRRRSKRRVSWLFYRYYVEGRLRRRRLRVVRVEEE